MREQHEAITKTGARVAVVTPSPYQSVQHFFKERQYPFPGYSDTAGKSYDAFGLGTASIWKLIGPRPKTLAAGIRAASKGHFIGMPSGDVHRLQGEFVIAKGGDIRYSFRSTDAADNPPLDEVFRHLS